MIHDVTLETFEEIVDTNDVVILDFWASWCAPCRIFAPVYEEASKKHPDIYFGKVNTEVATDLSQAFHVRSIPTIMMFKKGELVLEHAGVIPPGALDDLIDQARKLEPKKTENEL